ncbi:TonB-dependent receptor [Pseudoalteromonas neustonica]|uniref:TonB-dependent receptor n=1 Tax=Pseudoalteromonas neustonica TaxID=1840331 RepID=A0ABU9U069_9GAMM
MCSTRISPINIALLSCLSFSTIAFADDEQNKDSTLFIGDVIEVHGQSNGAKDVQLVGSVDVVNRDQLQNEHVNITVDLFTKIPGVYFSRFNQGVVSTDVAMRGFNGEGSMPHTKLLIDGIPSNLHVGLGEMDALFPMEVESIEVVKGNQDARYGLHNLAGNINMTSRRDDAKEVEFLAGSFDTYEAQGYFGDVNNGFSQHYFIGVRDTKGYRDHSALEKHTFSGKWFYQPSNNTELGVIARYFDYEADAPGYLTEQEAHRDSTQSADYAQNDSGDKQTRHLSMHLDHAFDPVWQLSVKSYIQQFDRHRYLQYTASSAQQERLEKDRQYGAVATLSATFSPTWLLSMGLDYQAQDNSNERFVTVTKVRQKQFRNWDFDYNNYGGFTQLQYRGERLLISGGLRFDGFSGDLFDGISEQYKTINDEGITLQPKFNVLYEMTDRLNLFANYGVSFQAPTGSKAYINEQSSGFDFSKNYGFETGAKWQLFDWLNTRLSVWQQDAKDELTPKTDGSGGFENIGETKRKGWDLALSADINTQWSGFASYTRQEAKLVEPGEAKIAQKGNWLLGVPEFTATAGIIYHPVNKLKVSLFGHFQGDYYVSNVIQDKQYGDYKLVDLAFDYDLGWGNAGLRINNLFDSYSDYVYLVGDETIHSPTDGRAINFSVSYRF